MQMFYKSTFPTPKFSIYEVSPNVRQKKENNKISAGSQEWKRI